MTDYAPVRVGLRRISWPTFYAVCKEIERAGKKVEGYWRYHPKASDETIAEELDVHPQMVTAIRCKVFGVMVGGPGQSVVMKNDSLLILERRISAIEAAINKAHSAMALNGVESK